MTSHADRGASLLAAKNYPLAIDAYTLALRTSLSPVWLIQRSIAYQRSKNHSASLLDAEVAILQAKDRGKRELMGQAQMRRAIALFGLGRIGDARLALTWTRKLNQKEKGLGMWVETVRKAYEALADGDEARKIGVEEWPDKKVVDELRAVLEGGDAPATKSTPEKAAGSSPVSTTEIKKAEPVKTQPVQAKAALAKSAQAVVAAPTARPAIQPTPKDKIRHEWYQSSTSVSISILAKGVSSDSATVDIASNHISVSFPTPTEPYTFTLSPTYGPVDVEKSNFKITPHKLELSLVKANGMKWSKLEGEAGGTPTTSAAAPQPAHSSPPQAQDHAPSYPTSSKHGPKDWDSLATSELQKARAEAAAAGGAEPRLDDDKADDEDEESDPLHGFFKKIYAGADPDTKKAMMKSFTESGGTALSTDWSKIGKEKTEVKAPEGYEEKKF